MRCLVSGVERPVYTLGGGGDVSLREACLFAILLKTVPLNTTVFLHCSGCLY